MILGRQGLGEATVSSGVLVTCSLAGRDVVFKSHFVKSVQTCA